MYLFLLVCRVSLQFVGREQAPHRQKNVQAMDYLFPKDESDSWYDHLGVLDQVCYDIIRANVQTGQVIWETSERNYLSNFALVGSRVYALREDLTLVAFDLDTGTILGTLQFDGPPAETVCRGIGGTVYWVVADGPYVLVYFGDTQELIALKERP